MQPRWNSTPAPHSVGERGRIGGAPGEPVPHPHVGRGTHAWKLQTLSRQPMTIATCMFHTGIDPFTKKAVYIARDLKDRKMQRALMQFFKPENYFEVRKALLEAGRADLIGGCEGLIPAQPPQEAIEARRQRSNSPDHYHTVANPARGEKAGERGLPNQGYRPGRNSAKRR